MRTVHNLLASAVVALIFFGAACANKQKTNGTAQASSVGSATRGTSGLKFEPDESQKAALDKLLQTINRNNWRFPSKETNQPENARLFTYLAATSSDPAVTGAALSAMYGAYSSHSKRKAQPDDDFSLVVKKHLGSKDPKIATRALLAARTAIAGKDGHPGLIAQVVELAGQDPYTTGPGRYAVIDTLRVVSANHRDPGVVKIFHESLAAKETYVLSYALQALYRSTRSIEDKGGLKARALELAAHENPGVRGRAIELLGAFGRDDAKVLEVVQGALADPSPYVRSEAAESVARLRHRPAIHRLIKLVDDKENNRYDIRDWTTLDGKPGRLHHDGSPWSHVYDAAMNAIRSLSGGELALERINPKEIDQGLDKNAATTRAWYAKAKGKIPTSDELSSEKNANTQAKATASPKAKPAPKSSSPAGTSAP